MIEHEFAYIFNQSDFSWFEKYINSEYIIIVDNYLSKNTRVRSKTSKDQSTCDYFITHKKGNKCNGYRVEDQEKVSKYAANLMISESELKIIKHRYRLNVPNSHDYDITIDLVQSPMNLMILEIESLIRDTPVPEDITQQLFDRKFNKCPFSSYDLFKRRIGVCGGPSAGKSEMSKHLSFILNTKYNANAFHVTEFATTFIQKYKRHPTFWDQFMVWHGQLSREQSADSANIILSDSPTFLSYIYLVHYKQFDLSEQTALYIAKLYKRVLLDLPKYTDVVFLELQDYKDNGVRFQNKDEATRISARVKQFLDEHRVPYLTATYNDASKILDWLFCINKINYV